MKRRSTTPAEDRILATANDLFYKQGYRATGINQIIDEAGVAKASFYAAFESKEALGAAYVRRRAEQEIALLRNAVETQTGARSRFMAVAKTIGPWMKAHDFRGCPFANIAAEVANESPPITAEVDRHETMFIDLLKEVTRDLAVSDPSYRDLDVEEVARRYYVIARGAIAAAQLLRSEWPADRAVEDIARLVERG